MTTTLEIQALINEGDDEYALRWTNDFENDLVRNYSASDGMIFDSKEECVDFFTNIFGMINESQVVEFGNKFSYRHIENGVCAHRLSNSNTLEDVINFGYDITDSATVFINLRRPFEVVMIGEVEGCGFVVIKY